MILFTRNLSWLNIKLLKAVVNKFGNVDDKKKLKEYKDLIPYLHQSIFEIMSMPSCHAENLAIQRCSYCYLVLQ